METQVWLLNTKATIDRLLFDSNYVMPAAPTKPLEAANKRTIMVVDDNESLRRFTAMLLEKQGFDVVQKEDGQQALDALDSDEIDLILMDIEMPIMDGVEASRRIRGANKAYSSVPIIAHTGDSSPSLWKMESSGMSDFIVKPADKTDCSIRLLTGFSECYRLKRTAIFFSEHKHKKELSELLGSFV